MRVPPAGCGGIKIVDADYGEVKRMYVRPQFSGLGLAKMMLAYLADYARARNIPLLRLETGIHQQNAIALYEREGFRRIPPFGTLYGRSAQPLLRKAAVTSAAVSTRLGR